MTDAILNFKGTIQTEDLEARKWINRLDQKIDDIKKQFLLIKLNQKETEERIKIIEKSLSS